jgi:hypothetical protein
MFVFVFSVFIETTSGVFSRRTENPPNCHLRKKEFHGSFWCAREKTPKGNKQQTVFFSLHSIDDRKEERKSFFIH